ATCICIGDDESLLVEAGLPTHAEHGTMIAHDFARHAQMVEAPACGRKRIRIRRDKRLSYLADDGGNLSHVADPQWPQAATHEDQHGRESVQHPRQPLGAISWIDHDQAEVYRLGLLP